MTLQRWRVSSDPSGSQAGRPQQPELRVCVRPSLALPAHTHGHHIWPEGRKPLWVSKACKDPEILRLLSEKNKEKQLIFTYLEAGTREFW